ncbi:hypothetical protein [Saccharospirillum salsuginis]|uniref:Zinc resistance-associated protein n=1 Tax=Saccharospirillum salsuginis TaxID=418750 RepID=A0A918K663_9GAMM|nr:hypothetical protein [Saccharospirillum salsuginis]GGX50473.1 hypothetical protein GCM10007392_17040 [Saccharospirillum salsuginis]
MRYMTTGLLALFASGLAWSEDTDSWGAWDELPSDVLDLSGETDPRALSRRLDQLIESNPESEELDQLLEVWLRQSTVSGNGRLMSLQSLIGMSEEDIEALPEAARQRREEMLDDLLSDLPAAAGNDDFPGQGPPDDLPAAGSGNNPGGGNGPGNGQGNGPPPGTPNGG